MRGSSGANFGHCGQFVADAETWKLDWYWMKITAVKPKLCHAPFQHRSESSLGLHRPRALSPSAGHLQPQYELRVWLGITSPARQPSPFQDSDLAPASPIPTVMVSAGPALVPIQPNRNSLPGTWCLSTTQAHMCCIVLYGIARKQIICCRTLHTSTQGLFEEGQYSQALAVWPGCLAWLSDRSRMLRTAASTSLRKSLRAACHVWRISNFFLQKAHQIMLQFLLELPLPNDIKLCCIVSNLSRWG